MKNSRSLHLNLATLVLGSIFTLNVFAIQPPNVDLYPAYGSSGSRSVSSTSPSTGKIALSGALGMFGPGANTIGGTNGNNNQQVFNRLSGLFGFGGDFDYLLKDDFSVGGTFRYYSTSDTLQTGGTATTNFRNALVVVGATARGYFSTENWLIPFGAGISLLSPSVDEGNTSYSIDTGFGLMWSLGFLYKINNNFSFGVENLRIIGLGEKLNGWLLDDFMFKGRFVL